MSARYYSTSQEGMLTEYEWYTEVRPADEKRRDGCRDEGYPYGKTSNKCIA
jgi:hypothetical protein